MESCFRSNILCVDVATRVKWNYLDEGWQKWLWHIAYTISYIRIHLMKHHVIIPLIIYSSKL